MKKVHLALAAFFSLLLTITSAQPAIPHGYQKGSVLLTDGSSLPGFIKENIRGNASITWVGENGGSKKHYDGSSLSGLNLDGISYICLKGDFFKLLSDGSLCFLQKASDAAGKITYNGSDASINQGSEGKPGDYFIYNKQTSLLQLVSAKNFDEVVAKIFIGNSAAIAKAGSARTDIPQLRDAVEIFNAANK